MEIALFNGFLVFFSLICLLGLAMVVFSRKLIYAALGLLMVLLAVAALYALFNAAFLAILQIMVYVGGIAILMIVGYLLTAKPQDQLKKEPLSFNRFVAFATCTALVVIFAKAIITNAATESGGLYHPSTYTTADIGVLMLSTYLVEFELSGLLLLIALVAGASYSAQSGAQKG